MNLNRAFRRRAALRERLARIERSGHPGFLPAASGHRTCEQHGDYIATSVTCPVCEGRSTGDCWSGWQHSTDYDDDIDPVTLEPVDWFERAEPRRSERRIGGAA